MDVQQDAGGFTITQQVRVSSRVRANYEAAVRMLEDGQYETGITMLQKVTDSAPELAAAHRSWYRLCRVGKLDEAEASLKKRSN